VLAFLAVWAIAEAFARAADAEYAAHRQRHADILRALEP